MKKYLIILLFFLVLSVNLFAKSESIAFGYFVNEDNKPEFKYLETIIPDSVVSSLLEHKIKLIRPKEVNKILEKKNNKLLRDYNFDDLQLLRKSIPVDYFVYGKFKSIGNSYIRINISLFCLKSNELFTFETIGKLETEIFALIDYLAAILKNVSSKNIFYKSTVIPDRSKFCILTNLKPYEMNEMYSVFLENDYKISVTQSSELYPYVSNDNLDYFNYIFTKNYGYDKLREDIVKKEKVNIFYGSWQNETDFNEMKIKEDFINVYYYDFSDYQKSLLQSLYKLTKNSNYLLIINFNRKRTSCSIRCIDLRNNKLIWIERNIKITKNAKKDEKSKIKALSKSILEKFLVTSGTVNN